MADVIWSLEALQDVTEVLRTAERTSAAYANSIGHEINASADLLASQPRIGSKVPEYDRDDIREWIVRRWRLIYRIRDENVEFVSFVDVNRRLPRTPPG